MPNKEVPETVLQDGQGLISRINEFIDQAVKADCTDQSENHPLIVINAVKNIIGDNRANPSQILLNLSEDYINHFPERGDDDQIIKEITKDGFGLTVFVDEVEEAIMSGDKDAAELESAKQLLASDQSPAILELLAELALHDISSMGLFTYHWLRSYQFHQDKNLLWSYTRSMINEMFKNNLKPTHQEISQSPQDCLETVLLAKHQRLWSTFAALNRLWEGDYVRLKNYKKSISYWLENLMDDEVHMVVADSKELIQYLNNGGHYFIEMAENMVAKHNEKTAIIKIVQLEGLRGLVKISAPESFPCIAQCINFIAS